MRIPPWLLALVVLIGICAIGAYIIHSRHVGVPDGYRTEGFTALGSCATAYNSCITGAGTSTTEQAACFATLETCRTAPEITYTTCMAAITRPTTVEAPVIPNPITAEYTAAKTVYDTYIAALATYNAAASKCLNAWTTYNAGVCAIENANCIIGAGSDSAKQDICQATANACNHNISSAPIAPPSGSSYHSAPAAIARANNLDDSGSKGADLAADIAEYRSLAALAEAGIDASGSLPDTLSESDLSKLSKIIQKSLSDSTKDPDGDTPGADDDGDGAPYTPSKTTIKPHHHLKDIAKSLTARSKSDDKSGVANIQKDAPLTPSMRQMIRNDVKQDIIDLQNEYEISYDDE